MCCKDHVFIWIQTSFVCYEQLEKMRRIVVSHSSSNILINKYIRVIRKMQKKPIWRLGFSAHPQGRAYSARETLELDVKVWAGSKRRRWKGRGLVITSSLPILNYDALVNPLPCPFVRSCVA